MFSASLQSETRAERYGLPVPARILDENLEGSDMRLDLSVKHAMIRRCTLHEYDEGTAFGPADLEIQVTPIAMECMTGQ